MMKAEPVPDLTRNTHNYFAQGGNELVIGGKLTFLPGAVIEGGDDLFTPSPPFDQIAYVPDSEATTIAALKDDYNALLDQAQQEQADQARPALAARVENWAQYDTIFVGYPIWWGIAAWPMSSFVAANDFSGKNVVPFCTSLSSGIGQSGKLLAELADAGTWLDGQRFSHSSSEADIASWVNGLNL